MQQFLRVQSTLTPFQIYWYAPSLPTITTQKLCVGGYEEAREGDQVLLPKKQKKDKDNSWRMDVDVNIVTNSTREDTNVEKVVEAEIKSDDESES